MTRIKDNMVLFGATACAAVAPNSMLQEMQSNHHRLVMI